MCAERQRLRPWLEDKINSGKVPGLFWRDKDRKEFRVSWKHAGKPDFDCEKDAKLFQLWAEHTEKYKDGESPDPSTWKTRFRCALHKMPDVEEVRVPHSLDEKEPYRVFRFTDKGVTPKKNTRQKTKVEPKAEKSPSQRYQPYPCSTSHKPMVIRPPPPESDRVDYSFNLHSQSMRYDDRQQESPYQPDSSDGSFDDSCDLDDITPTITPYYPSNTVMAEEPLNGSPDNQFFPYPDIQGIYSGDYVNNGLSMQFPVLDYSTRMEMLGAFLAHSSNGLMGNGSVFGENTEAFMQHFMAANPGGLMNMKLWFGGMVIPDESSAVSSTSSNTHLNMDNGLLELGGDAFDAAGRMVVPRIDRSTLPARAAKSSLEPYDSLLHIRVFYGSHEVLSNETRLAKGERAIRFFYGSSKTPDIIKMNGARQIQLPEVNSNCRQIAKVVSFLTPGILLEITEDFDMLATRHAALKVFYSNGCKDATKLEREKCTKVFDYKGRFLPTLKEIRNGIPNCEYPNCDVIFYLGRADSSLVSIVVTHVKAKMSLHNESTAEPNPSEQLSTSLEQDCFC